MPCASAGTTSVVSAGWWAPSQLAACRQYDGTWVNEPGCSACPLRYGSARPASPATAATAPATRITRHRQTARASTCAMPSASTTASTGSILNTLRSADSVPFSRSWTSWCSGPPSGPL